MVQLTSSTTRGVLSGWCDSQAMETTHPPAIGVITVLSLSRFRSGFIFGLRAGNRLGLSGFDFGVTKICTCLTKRQ